MDLAEHLVDYFNKIRKLFEDKQIDVSNHKNKFTFMRQFVKNHISGIHLVEGEVEVCPSCGYEHPKKDRLSA